MDTPVHTQRPGMPPIESTPEPQAAGLETMNQPEVGVGDASADSGSAFVNNLLNPMSPEPVVPPTIPVAPQVPGGIPVAPQQPAPQPSQVPPQPQGQPDNLDFSNRYGKQDQSATPDLSPLPDLPPETSIETPQNLGDQQNHAFAAMRAAMNASRRAAEEYRAKYNEIVASTQKFKDEKTEFANQLNEKDKRISELEAEIGRSDLSKSPEFREKYDAPITAIRDQVAQILVANGIEQSQATDLSSQILQSDPADVPGLIQNLPTHVQGMIMIHSQNADKLWADRDIALENWKQSADGLAAAASRGSAIVQAQHIGQLADRAIEIVKSMPVDKGAVPAYQVVDPQFAADRDIKERQFKAWVQQAPEEQRYAAMFEGFMAPKTYQMLQQTWLENEQLKNFITTRMRIAVPPMSAVRGAAPVPPPPPAPTTPQVSTDGYSPAESGVTAQGFAAGLIDNMLSGGVPGM